MKRALTAIGLVACLGVAGTSFAGPPQEGCVSTWASGSCQYIATRPGSIVGEGAWTVKVWWNGQCGSGSAPDWIVSSSAGSPSNPGNGNNLPGGLAGAWEGSIAEGSCARAVAITQESAVVIGSLDALRTGMADDRGCASSEAGIHGRPDTSDQVRGYLCVSDGDAQNGAELYIGGEVLTEQAYDNGLPSCGAIEVAGRQGPGVDPATERTVFGDDGWGGSDPDAACQ